MLILSISPQAALTLDMRGSYGLSSGKTTCQNSSRKSERYLLYLWFIIKDIVKETGVSIQAGDLEGLQMQKSVSVMLGCFQHLSMYVCWSKRPPKSFGGSLWWPYTVVQLIVNLRSNYLPFHEGEDGLKGYMLLIVSFCVCVTSLSS